jgi:hypothetical protein
LELTGLTTSYERKPHNKEERRSFGHQCSNNLKEGGIYYYLEKFGTFVLKVSHEFPSTSSYTKKGNYITALREEAETGTLN